MAKRETVFTERELETVCSVAKANGARAVTYEAPGGHKVTFDLSVVSGDSLQDQPNPYDGTHG